MTGMVAGTVAMTVIGVVVNALVMLPFFAKFFGMPLATIVGMGAAINPAVYNVWTFALICVGPFNLIKGTVVSLVTSLIYKRISILIRSAGKQEISGRTDTKKGNANI